MKSNAENSSIQVEEPSLLPAQTRPMRLGRSKKTPKISYKNDYDDENPQLSHWQLLGRRPITPRVPSNSVSPEGIQIMETVIADTPKEPNVENDHVEEVEPNAVNVPSPVVVSTPASSRTDPAQTLETPVTEHPLPPVTITSSGKRVSENLACFLNSAPRLDQSLTSIGKPIQEQRSFSTPRKKNRHVRNLQFKTPPSLSKHLSTIEEERLSSSGHDSSFSRKRSVTSPNQYEPKSKKRLEWTETDSFQGGTITFYTSTPTPSTDESGIMNYSELSTIQIEYNPESGNFEESNHEQLESHPPLYAIYPEDHQGIELTIMDTSVPVALVQPVATDPPPPPHTTLKPDPPVADTINTRKKSPRRKKNLEEISKKYADTIEDVVAKAIRDSNMFGLEESPLKSAEKPKKISPTASKLKKAQLTKAKVVTPDKKSQALRKPNSSSPVSKPTRKPRTRKSDEDSAMRLNASKAVPIGQTLKSPKKSPIERQIVISPSVKLPPAPYPVMRAYGHHLVRPPRTPMDFHIPLETTLCHVNVTPPPPPYPRENSTIPSSQPRPPLPNTPVRPMEPPPPPPETPPLPAPPPDSPASPPRHTIRTQSEIDPPGYVPLPQSENSSPPLPTRPPPVADDPSPPPAANDPPPPPAHAHVTPPDKLISHSSSSALEPSAPGTPLWNPMKSRGSEDSLSCGPWAAPPTPRFLTAADEVSDWDSPARCMGTPALMSDVANLLYPEFSLVTPIKSGIPRTPGHGCTYTPPGSVGDENSNRSSIFDTPNMEVFKNQKAPGQEDDLNTPNPKHVFIKSPPRLPTSILTKGQQKEYVSQPSRDDLKLVLKAVNNTTRPV